MPLSNLTSLKGIIGPPLDIGGDTSNSFNAKFFTHVVTSGEETSNTVTLTNVVPPLTIAVTLLIQRTNGDVVHPGSTGIDSITPSGNDLIIDFSTSFSIFENNIVLAIEGATA